MALSTAMSDVTPMAAGSGGAADFGLLLLLPIWITSGSFALGPLKTLRPGGTGEQVALLRALSVVEAALGSILLIGEPIKLLEQLLWVSAAVTRPTSGWLKLLSIWHDCTMERES